MCAKVIGCKVAKKNLYKMSFLIEYYKTRKIIPRGTDKFVILTEKLTQRKDILSIDRLNILSADSMPSACRRLLRIHNPYF